MQTEWIKIDLYLMYHLFLPFLKDFLAIFIYVYFYCQQQFIIINVFHGISIKNLSGYIISNKNRIVKYKNRSSFLYLP